MRIVLLLFSGLSIFSSLAAMQQTMEVRLTNGKEVNFLRFLSLCKALEHTRCENYSHFETLVQQAFAARAYTSYDNSIVKSLVECKIVPPEKYIIACEECRNIILCGVKKVNEQFMLYDATKYDASRTLFEILNGTKERDPHYA